MRGQNGLQDGGPRRRLFADPPGDLGDCGCFEAAGVSAILEAGMPTRGKAGAGGEVAGLRLEEDGIGPYDHGAKAEVGVDEGPGEEVETVEGG